MGLLAIAFISSANEFTSKEKPKDDMSKIFMQGTEPPNPNIDFYACKFNYVQTVNELITQFYYNLGGNCLLEISLQQLANDLGINIVDKRSQGHHLIRAKKSDMNDIIVTRYYDSFIISATDSYFKRNYSLFPKNILPKKIKKPSVFVKYTIRVQPTDYMKGDLLKLPYFATYLWSPVRRGRFILFYNRGDNVIKQVDIVLNKFNL